jgi:hypothetical protein
MAMPSTGTGICADKMVFCMYSASSFKIGETAMETIELIVELKIPDVTALTATSTLRQRLGYQNTLVQLKRADYYRLGLCADSTEQALKIGRALAEQTNLFVNPLKQRYQLHAGLHNPVVSADDDTYVAHVLVSNRDNQAGDKILHALQERLGYAEQVQSVLTGTLWILLLKATDADHARDLAEQIAVTRSQHEGLLQNPHYQASEAW